MPNRRYSQFFPIIFIVSDLVALNLSIGIANVIKFESFIFRDESYSILYILINILWVSVFFASRLNEIRRESRLLEHLNGVLSALVVNLAIVFALWFLTKPYYYSREHLFLLYLFFTLLILSWRLVWHYFIRYYRSKGYNNRKVVIIGSHPIAEELTNLFEVDKGIGYEFLGFFDDDVKGDQILGTINELEDYVLENDVDIIFCYLPKLAGGKITQVINFAENNLIKVKIISQFSALGYSLTLQNYGSIPVLNITSLPLDKIINQYIKRMFDLTFALFVFIFLLSWLIPIIALTIKMESRGPIFFRQERNGLNNKKFKIWKFRSMSVHDDTTVIQARKGDDRITKVGAFLRKTSIDELPQFVNVLMGDMSVVGPRPHAVEHNEEFRKKIDKFIQRHAVKPGITGLAQAKGYRGETTTFNDIQGRVRLDRFYVKNWSLLLDFKIIVLTVVSILKGSENAY